MLNFFINPDRSEWSSLLERPSTTAESAAAIVPTILQAIKNEGDSALFRYARELDSFKGENFVVSVNELNEAASLISDELKEAIDLAKSNIEKYHKHQINKEIPIETMPGILCERIWSPIERIGLYIPGGSAPLFSTVLMLGIPARLAGVKSIALCTPSNPQGKIHPAILYTAQILGITEIYKLGGAHAIGALAYGTQSIPRCFKIFGPGNNFVSLAKALVSLDGTAIDMLAGPSELAIIADGAANPDFIAADLLSQAEHGPDSQVLLLSDNIDLVSNVRLSIQNQLKELPRADIAKKALQNSKAIILSSSHDICELINLYAPEHLIINTKSPRSLLPQIHTAGSIFLGPYSPESAGDYASGTNHTLPTSAQARVSGGVSIDSFVKKISVQELSFEGLQNIAKTIEIMAEEEGLIAHRNAVRIRFEKQ